MIRKADSPPRRQDSLSRERIVDAAIELLDRDGAAGLTFRALSQHLATGPGALYGHIADKDDLLAAACDAVVLRTLASTTTASSPQASVRALALGVFEAMDDHPWIGSALIRAAARMPLVRLFERLGQQVRALGVPDGRQWATASALLSYILGVGGQNAAQAQFARAGGLVRTTYLDAMATSWSALDPATFPFARSMAQELRANDDRADFLAGIDLLLAGIERLQPETKRPPRGRSSRGVE